MKKLEQRVPNLRFKGFTDDWEQRKLGDLFVYNRPDKYMVQDTNYIDSGTPVLTANKSFVLGYTNENHTYNKLPAIIFDDFTLENKFVKFPFMVKSSAIKILNSRNDQPMMFMYQLLQHSRFVHEGHSRHYISIVQRKDVMVPDYVEEQKKIATLFSRIQNIITLQQRKLALLKQLKKGLLQKMFADKDSKQPVLRFKGFHDDWEQHKLGEIITYYNGKSHEEQFRNAETQNFELVTLKSIDGNGNLCSSEKYIDSTNNTLSKNDLIMVLSEQNTGLVGMTTLIPRDNYYVLNQRVALLKLHKNNSPFFLTDAINQHQIFFERMSAGTKVQNISKSNVENFNLYIPNYSEQKEVGHIIALCQNIITLQQQKLAKYQSIKKSLLQQMFI